MCKNTAMSRDVETVLIAVIALSEVGCPTDSDGVEHTPSATTVRCGTCDLTWIRRQRDVPMVDLTWNVAPGDADV